GGRAIAHQVRGVTVMGVDERFWPAKGDGDGLVLNDALAGLLEAAAGDRVSLRLQKPSAIPRETMLGRRDESAIVEEWTLPVGRVLRADEPADRFSLRPEMDAPRTVFLPLHLLQDRLGLAGRCNALLAGEVRSPLAEALRSNLQLADWG